MNTHQEPRVSDGASHQGRGRPLPAGEVYDAVLRANLGAGFYHFFRNPRRLVLLRRLLDSYFRCDRGVVLEVGSGAFAVEVFLESLAKHRVIAFDYTWQFARLSPLLRGRGLLRNTSFFVGNALEVEFRPASFDLVIMQDIFYEPALSAEPLVKKYDAYLRSGGLLFLDVMDIRARWLWKLLGKERAYKRYDIAKVVEALGHAGYQVLEHLPFFGAHGGLGRAFRFTLWYVFGLANSFAILARKSDRP